MSRSPSSSVSSNDLSSAVSIRPYYAARRGSCDMDPRGGDSVRRRGHRFGFGDVILRVMPSAPLRLYDEHAGEPVEVALRDRMSVYVCGITPYDSAHVGHAFLYAHFDVLVRLLRRSGVLVDHVQNVT